MILLDTSFLVAMGRAGDENHARAIQSGKGFQKCAITSDILSEFVTFIGKRDGNAKAHDIAAELLGGSCLCFSIIWEDYGPALVMLKKYPNMSFCDCTSVVAMKRLGITEIASFDSDFDRVPGIKRIF